MDKLDAKGWIGGLGQPSDILDLEVHIGLDSLRIESLSNRMEAVVRLPDPPARPRVLRRLATFHRLQGTIGAAMDFEDELRALRVVGSTLDALPLGARWRVLDYVRRRCETAPVPTVSEAESVRIAKDRVLG